MIITVSFFIPFSLSIPPPVLWVKKGQENSRTKKSPVLLSKLKAEAHTILLSCGLKKDRRTGEQKNLLFLLSKLKTAAHNILLSSR
ncbi:MAG: hypothetical protein K2G23_02510 [Muribaculaceae bacterium]|nr:hypothetical protein [Muribaculaceae bacterium]